MTALASQTAGDAPPRPGMTWIPGGRFRMGSDRRHPEEAPARAVAVDGFWIDTRPVTNLEFARFVEATGWTTFAELPADPADSFDPCQPKIRIPRKVLKGARTFARRPIAAVIARPRATPSRSTPRPRTWASASSCGPPEGASSWPATSRNSSAP